MSKGESEKRISISIKIPSAGLMLFIEKAMKDDNFFEAAIENPLQTLKENGVRLNVESLKPEDLATFFGALAGAKELIKKKKIEDIKFENVFGEAAELIGATIIAETNRGMWTLFNRDAFIEKGMFSSSRVNFKTRLESLRSVFTEMFKDRMLDIKMSGQENIAVKVDTEANQYREVAFLTQSSFAGKTESYKSTDTGTTFHFDANQGVGSKTSSSIDTYKTKDFSGIGILDERSFIEQILNGPLINPVDLVNIAAQINTFVSISERM
jgi:hypothetical protein